MDVEMKDATEQPLDVEKDDKLPHSVTGEGTQPVEVGKDENLDGVAEPKDESVAAKNIESEVASGNSKENAELGTEENLDGVTKPQNVDAAKNIGSELESLASKGPAELGTHESLDGVTEPKDEVMAAKNTESKEIANEDKMAAAQLGEKTGEDQKMNENSELEKTSTEKETVPAELTVEKASRNGTVDSEKKVEPSSENEGMLNDPKQSENTVPPTASLEDGDTNMTKIPKAERECSDANQNSTVVDTPKFPAKEGVPTTASADTNASLGTSLDDPNPATPLSMIKGPTTRSGGQSEESYRNMFVEGKIPGDVVGTPDEQAAFLRELERFYREKATDFKAPKFYGNQLNCLKLWRSVVKLGGYDRVTGSKLWRQVGESFHPPKTCTTVSWTFRIFYEKALLEYERHMTEKCGLQLPQFASSDPSSVDELLQGSSLQPLGSGRARRDSATRAMQGWHSRQDNSEGGDQMMQDKNGNNMIKREKSIKSIGSLKQKRPDEMEHPVKAARIEHSKQLVTSVVDVGPPAEWVRINVRETKDCYEVYALVPGLLREEVRIQSDPAGRLVITGQPEQPDNPWGITAFKKVVSLPGRIDPLQTSAVVSLHGRLFVRVPFEQ